MIPTNKNPLSIPLLNLKSEYNIIVAAKIQKNISSKSVKKLLVLNDFLKILKKSKSMPIKKPFNIKTANKNA